MDTVDMETSVTLDIVNKFAMITTVIYFLVKKDILEIVDGSRTMEDVNLHHTVNTNIQKLIALKK